MAGDNDGDGDGDAVLFLFIAEILGVGTYYFLSRHVPDLPWMSVLFLEGAFLGMLNRGTDEGLGALSSSIKSWLSVDPKVLLLITLPTLMFSHASEVNWFMFKSSFWQTVFVGVVGVVIGTLLTAGILYAMPSLGFSFEIALAVGSLLSAIDPVAVIPLLEEVGASPRLRTLISGESMITDGSGVALWGIFLDGYLYSRSKGETGTELTAGSATGLYLKEIIVGPLIGIAFGVITLWCISRLNRRPSAQDGTSQIMLTLAAAYLSFFVAEQLLHASGVLATMFCAICLSAFARPMYVARRNLEAFWRTLRYGGDALIFTLGGVFWGDILLDEDRSSTINATDWGLLFALYFCVILIRAIVHTISYPVVANIGLKTSPRNVAFTTWAGLKGTVVLALAVALERRIETAVPDDEVAMAAGIRAVFLVGGVSLLTLVINGTTSGFVLNYLGLTGMGAAKRRILETVERRLLLEAHTSLEEIRNANEYPLADYYHVGILIGILKDNDDQGFEKHRTHDAYRFQQQKQHEQTEQHEQPKKTEQLEQPEQTEQFEQQTQHEQTDQPEQTEQLEQHEQPKQTEPTEPHEEQLLRSSNKADHAFTLMHSKRGEGRVHTSIRNDERLGQGRWSIRNHSRSKISRRHDLNSLELMMLRMVFLQTLRGAYWRMIRQGVLDEHSFSAYVLLQSVDIAAAPGRCEDPLDDWDAVNVVDKGCEHVVESSFLSIKTMCRYRSVNGPVTIRQRIREEKLLTAICFLKAHVSVEAELENFFTSYRRDDLDPYEYSVAQEIAQQVLRESIAQRTKAKEHVRKAGRSRVKWIQTQMVAHMVVSREIQYVKTAWNQGLIDKGDAEILFAHLHEQQQRIKHFTRQTRIKGSTRSAGSTKSTRDGGAGDSLQRNAADGRLVAAENGDKSKEGESEEGDVCDPHLIDDHMGKPPAGTDLGVLMQVPRISQNPRKRTIDQQSPTTNSVSKTSNSHHSHGYGYGYGYGLSESILDREREKQPSDFRYHWQSPGIVEASPGDATPANKDTNEPNAGSEREEDAELLPAGISTNKEKLEDGKDTDDETGRNT